MGRGREGGARGRIARVRTIERDIFPRPTIHIPRLAQHGTLRARGGAPHRACRRRANWCQITTGLDGCVVVLRNCVGAFSRQSSDIKPKKPKKKKIATLEKEPKNVCKAVFICLDTARTRQFAHTYEVMKEQ